MKDQARKTLDMEKRLKVQPLKALHTKKQKYLGKTF